MNKAMIESYVRNLIGQVIGAVMIVMQTSNAATPLDFGSSEWLLVANALWASLVPVAIRYFNKQDPAFGRVAAIGFAELSKRFNQAAFTSTTDAKFTNTPAKKAAAKKAAPKKK